MNWELTALVALCLITGSLFGWIARSKTLLPDMKLLPLTPVQRSFVEVEIIGRYEDDNDPRIRNTINIVKAHLGARFGGGLAVPSFVLENLLLETINSIDDAITNGKSEHEGFGTPKQARALHRTGSALLTKVRRALA